MPTAQSTIASRAKAISFYLDDGYLSPTQAARQVRIDAITNRLDCILTDALAGDPAARAAWLKADAMIKFAEYDVGAALKMIIEEQDEALDH